jgi:Cu-Zn family superoxide dismutase
MNQPFQLLETAMKLNLLGLTAAALLAGCASMQATGPAAVAKLEPTKGNTATGTVTFTQVGDKVRVEASLSGLKPNAEHGFHIHDKGDCSSGDGMSTGGHFNPLGKPHGMHTGMERHAGDLPAVQSDAYGNAQLTAMMDVITVTPGATSIVGRGMIVHRDPDDYKTQPTGNAGPRIACGVITAKQ